MTSWRVLVADDDAEVCALIRTLLAKGPYHVTVCHDAETALDVIAKEAPFDLLISDFMLPGISGIDLIVRLRCDPQSARLPIVMISGHGADLMEARAKAAGADAFLTKPFALAEFRAMMNRLLPGELQAASTS
jgi:CheY-like chemotaxis protein